MPLNRYMHTLLPARSELSPFRAPPVLRPFSVSGFLKTLADIPPPTSSMSTAFPEELYRSFLESDNFAAWHKGRRHTANKHLYQQYLRQILSADLRAQLPSIHEVELVDLYLRVKEELASQRRLQADGKRNTSIGPLLELLSHIIDSLPTDLQETLRRKEQLAEQKQL